MVKILLTTFSVMHHPWKNALYRYPCLWKSPTGCGGLHNALQHSCHPHFLLQHPAGYLEDLLSLRKTYAFSTCASHLVSVMLFYGPFLFMYSRPSSTYSLEKDKVAALFYTVVNPLFNPLIYSLRNKDVKGAFRKASQTIQPHTWRWSVLAKCC